MHRETPVALFVFVLAVSMVSAAWAGEGVTDLLPPVAAWNGESRALVVGDDHPWQTPAEASDLRRSPTYDETMAWLERLAAATPRIHLTSLGSSHEGREIRMAVISAEGATTPGQLHASGKPVMLVHAGIHSGEIDGKDAGMMLLRDLTVGESRAELLEDASLLFIPILNVDGHERSSALGRVNQRGPEMTGWRTNARNLNLNRDFAKLDTPELRALLGAINSWQPDLYLDLHVTDGVDYQYDITWGSNGPQGWSPAIAEWLATRYDDEVAESLRRMGHVPGPLIFVPNYEDFSSGLVKWTAGPRYSNGYGDARHLPTVLVENHSLKPFDRRVLGTYVLLEASLRALGRHGEELREATAADRARRLDKVSMGWEIDRQVPPERMELLSIEHRRVPSHVLGTDRVEWMGQPVTETVNYYRRSKPSAEVEPPLAYWVPPAWPEVIERLAHHGIEFEVIDQPRVLEVEMYRLQDPVLEETAFEGRVRLSTQVESERRIETFPPGSVRVPVDQDLGTLAMLLLEPVSADSFLQTGFFHEILQRTEYMEGYILDPLARRMMDEDPELEREFRQRVEEDEEFASDRRARMTWFYERSPYADERWKLYPVAREIASPPSPTAQ